MRVINVMTQLPVQIQRGSGGFDLLRTRGTLALFASHQYMAELSEYDEEFVAWTGECPELLESEKIEVERELPARMHPVWLFDANHPEESDRGLENPGLMCRWRRFAELIIWPVFHYIQLPPSDGLAENEWWHDYVKFNEAYFNKLKQVYRPGDIIWIHDYYLLLLPLLCRMEWPDATIGFYLHAPWPSLEYFRCLLKRSQLLEGLLGANQVGFQLPLFVLHFLLCCQRIGHCEVKKNKVELYGSQVTVVTMPIGIDVARIEREAFVTAVDEKVEALRQVYANCKIIVGRDRLDSVRGVEQKLEAFEMFLLMYPEWHNKVVMIQVLSLGYGHLAKVENKVTELVTRINATYGLMNYTPVWHYQMYVAKEEYLALLRVADVCLITSVRDGMNTTSLEYVVCQKQLCSPLILLEFTGTATVLKDAILVNPWDLVGIAKQLRDCLDMTPSRKQLLETKLYSEVTSNTVQTWTDNFLTSLSLLTLSGRRVTPALDRPAVYASYQQAKRRLFLFDYDGTLTPIVKDPNAAIPLSRLNHVITALAADPRNIIWIVSGRDQAFLDKWMGDKRVGLLAEHGCFMKELDKDWVNLAEKLDMLWQPIVDEVFTEVTERTPGAHVERKKVALTWHYRRADAELAAKHAAATQTLLETSVAEKYDVEIMAGKANIEVRPKVLNKGEIVKRLVLSPWGEPLDVTSEPDLGKINPSTLPDFVLCLGDDLTDEDMFRLLINLLEAADSQNVPKIHPNLTPLTLAYGLYPVVVGPALKKTVATSHLNDPTQVLETLGLLAGQVSLFESPGTVELDDEGRLTSPTKQKI